MEQGALPNQSRSHVDGEASDLSTRRLSPLAQRFCWFALLTLHLTCSAYYITISWCYWALPGTLLDSWLAFYRLGLGSDTYSAVAIVHACFAAIHFSYLAWMIGWSFKKRELVLAVYNEWASSVTNERPNRNKSSGCRSLFSKLSVNGPYFDFVLLGREVLETALQTTQAYRMSFLLSRAALNRSYVALLVLNCWFTAVVHHVFRANATNRRLWAIICDCVLDLVTSVGVTSALLMIYSSQFIVEESGFPSYQWYEDAWVVQVMSEFQVLMVGDFAMRVVFALSMITNTNNLKKLLSSRMTSAMNVQRTSYKCKTSHGIAAVVPLNPSLTDIKAAHKRGRLKGVAQVESWLIQILFFVWGMMILGLHLYAESIATFPQCKMQVKPWFSSQPSCSFVKLDCYASELNGTEAEATAQWSPFDPEAIVSVVIHHCPSLEMPSKLAQFSGLKVLKVYNSTISSWQESAGVSQVHHPKLLMLFLVRVNMTNGELPAGLYRNELPRDLQDIEFCVTNLRILPEDLALTWPHFATVYIEASNLTEIPPSLVKLAPRDLSLALNPISSIPAAMLERNPGYLHVGGTLISELPGIVEDISPTFKIRVDNTNISFFWSWIDIMVEKADGGLLDGVPTIVASSSPYCLDLQRIYDGEQTVFSAPKREGQSLLLSDASEENWKTLARAVACDPWPATYYPIEFEDDFSGIKSA